MFNLKTSFVGLHVMHEVVMYYWKTCCSGGSCQRTCLVGGHVSQVCVETVTI